MIPLFLAFPAALIQSPGLPSDILPPAANALIKAQDWPGFADWFETVPPATRGAHYELWIQSLNRSRRWERLLTVCDALLPQIEAKTGPRLSTCRLCRAQALTQLQRHGEAAAAHAENGRLGYPDGLPNACAEARLAQDWPALLAHAEALLSSRPDDAQGLAGKGEALARMDRFTEAEPLLNAAVAKDGSIAYAWNNLGRCLNERKAWPEAIAALDRALALEPGQVEALFNRGRARFELKRYAESRDDFRAALALRPGDPVLAENLRQAERYAALPSPAKRK
ncbi:tetratricopeptide repeat protein [Geothrix sp. 21YS21S-4]|uniref:tetratricopeptide repeat protein n=1 Tax=Geothrix sp. 21YS21S-4 TaxID=3068889 RepID=UPI0027B9B48A|nr:tetratricopeptide repeat protein [Geothrix sp. 21YS21S-4]